MSRKERKPAEKLTPFQVFAYSFGTFGYTLQQSVTNTFYIYFLTNVVYIASGTVALITTVSRFIMMFWGPVKGWLVQHFTMPWGKFRSWLIVFEPIGCFLTCCLYVRMTGSPTWVAFFYAAMWIIAQVVGDFSEVAALGLLPLIAKDSRDQMNISTLRAIMNSAGTIVHSLLTLPLVAALGGSDLAKGYFWVMVIYTAIDTLAYWGVAWVGTDYDIYPEDLKETAEQPKEDSAKYPVSVYVDCFFRNPPLLCHFLGNLFKAIATMVMNGAMAYYFTYIIGDLEKMTAALLIANSAQILGNWFSNVLSKAGLQKKTCNILAESLFAGGLIAPFLFWRGNLTAFIIFASIARFGSAMNVTLSPTMYADISEYYENKTGINVSGFIFTFFNWVFQIASVCTAGLVAGSLAAAGFDAKVAPTAGQLDLIAALATLIPGLIALAGTVCFALYPLTDRKVQQIKEELAAKKAAAAAEE